MTTFVLKGGKLVEKSRASSNAPYVISDTMDAVKHMGTGQMIDSKSGHRAATKASGCVEIGNEPIRPRKAITLDKGQRREAIARAIYDLRNGNR